MPLYICAYVIPAVLLWSLLGAVVWWIAGFQEAISLIAFGYALLFGLVETLGAVLPTPSSRWQVPDRWLKGHSLTAQTLIWGVVLGPGFITRNPFAGIWLVPLLLTLNQSLPTMLLASALVGAAHASGRAIGILTNIKHVETSCGHLLILSAQLRWKFVDGLTLLVA